MMKKNKPCNYRGADFLYIKSDDEGIHLKSTDKYLDNVVVRHKDKKYIREGFVPDKRRSYR